MELEVKGPVISSLGTQGCRVLLFSERHPRFLSYPSPNQRSHFKEDQLRGFETTEIYVVISMGSLSYLSLMGLGLEQIYPPKLFLLNAVASCFPLPV